MSKPTTHRIWQYSSTAGGIEKNLKLTTAPMPTPKASEHLVRIVACALNPVDYKPAEVPLAGYLIKKPATPGFDIAGRIVAPASGSGLQPGQLVFGAATFSPFQAGGLAEYVTVPQHYLLPIPAGLSPIDAATIPVAGLTAYQSIVPHVRPGDRVFLNGGSGGTGVFGIQIAKAVGCHVTVTCSARNVEFCRACGADEVVDYTAGDLLTALKALPPFDHVVENVGVPRSLYWRCHEFTSPGAKYVNVASAITFSDLGFVIKALVLPGFLGGGKRKLVGFFAQPVLEDLRAIGEWMVEGKVRAVIDERFAFEGVVEAFGKLKTGRARGKIVVDVAPE